MYYYFVFAEKEILAEKEKLYGALEYSSNSKAAAYPEEVMLIKYHNWSKDIYIPTKGYEVLVTLKYPLKMYHPHTH